MNGSWLTFLTSDPPVSAWADELQAASFGIQELPTALAGGGFGLTCSLCGHELKASLFPVDWDSDSEGKRLVEASIADARKAPPGCDVDTVLGLLRETQFVIRSSEPFLPKCDCEFRFHQVIASGEFLWYVDGRGFADDVETWLEL